MAAGWDATGLGAIKGQQKPTIGSQGVASSPRRFQGLKITHPLSCIFETTWELAGPPETTPRQPRIRRLQVRILPSAPKSPGQTAIRCRARCSVRTKRFSRTSECPDSSPTEWRKRSPIRTSLGERIRTLRPSTEDQTWMTSTDDSGCRPQHDASIDPSAPCPIARSR